MPTNPPFDPAKHQIQQELKAARFYEKENGDPESKEEREIWEARLKKYKEAEENG